MNKVLFGDVVKRININVDRFNTDRLYYIGKGATIEPNAFTVEPQGRINATLGFKFHFGFNPGHILFMSRCFDQHKAATATFAGICSDSTYIVETKDESVLLQRYLQLEMQSDRFWQWCEEHKSGGVNYLINYSTLETYEFDLPTIDEQKILSDKVWAAYELKQSYLNMIDATEEMVKSQFIEMFGNTSKKVSLTSLCDTFIDGDWIEAKDQSDSGIRLIQTGNVGVGEFKDKGDKARFITEDTFKRLNCTEIYEGDILISRLPDPVGRACIIPKGLGRTITAVDCTIVRLKDNMLPDFFVTYTDTPDYAMQIKKVLSGTTRLRVSRANLGKIQVPLPDKEEQIKFVDIVHQADKSEFELRKSIDAIDKVIKSLINENL